MRCAKCNTENRDGAAFCVDCGAKLVLACPECGAELPLSAKFCDKCGTEVQPPGEPSAAAPDAVAERLQRLVPKEFAERLLATRGQVEAERRMVTILFSDVKGSTAMAENLDPEDVMEIMNGAFDVLIEPVYRYEGTLARLMGDAILAFFGAPIAHEDDPERACRAALEIIEGAGRYAAKLEDERGIQGFNVRVGINTGLVVVGEVGSDLRVEYTAMGDAINLAARMEQNAPSGGILITHDTYRHVRGVFDVQHLDPLTVKGRAQPVQTYIVQRAKPRAFRKPMRGVEGIETRMVGREAELITLQNAYRDAVEDAETHVVTIVGDAGVGKTRLLDEFFNWIDLLPETTWYFKGRAVSTTQAVPYSVIRNMLAYRFDILDSDSAAMTLQKSREGMAGILEPDRADLVGQLAGFDFQTAGSQAVQALLGSPNFGQLATAYFVQYFRGMLAQQPLVMLLEDMQWADDSSLDLVTHLVAHIPHAPLLIVGAARPALFERRPSWGEGQEAYKHLDLEPLSKRASRALVVEILQKVPHLPEDLRELVVEGAEGNPFYVEELIKMLVEDKVIVRGDEEWQVALDRLAQVCVPPTLTAVLQARLDALPQSEKAVLQRASVVGRLFWDHLVGELIEGTQEREELGPLLGALRQRELVFRRERSSFSGTKEYTFKHNILRDVTYETVLRKMRRRYHAQVAGWLEAHAGERLGEYLGVIAGHYELAGEAVKAAEYLRRSGEEAYKVSAFRDARDAFQRALKLLPPEQATEQSALLVLLGQTSIRFGDFAPATASLEESLALARAAGNQQTEAAALSGLGQLAWRQGNWDTAQCHLQDGLALAELCGDTAGQAVATRHLARVSWLGAEYDQAVRWAQESQRLYQQTGDRQGVMAARNELAIVAVKRGELDNARAYFADNLALAREMGDRSRAAQALNNLGEVAREQGEYDEARAYYEQCQVIWEEIGDRPGLALALGNLSMVCLAKGLDGAARDYVRRSLRENLGIQNMPHALADLVQVAHLQARAGQPQQAAGLLGLALNHPASYSEVESDAQPVLAMLREALPPEQLEAALARGAKVDLEQVVAEILADTET